MDLKPSKHFVKTGELDVGEVYDQKLHNGSTPSVRGRGYYTPEEIKQMVRKPSEHFVKTGILEIDEVYDKKLHNGSTPSVRGRDYYTPEEIKKIVGTGGRRRKTNKKRKSFKKSSNKKRKSYKKRV
jgi:hypothetical protein